MQIWLQWYVPARMTKKVSFSTEPPETGESFWACACLCSPVQQKMWIHCLWSADFANSCPSWRGIRTWCPWRSRSSERQGRKKAVQTAVAPTNPSQCIVWQTRMAANSFGPPCGLWWWRKWGTQSAQSAQSACQVPLCKGGPAHAVFGLETFERRKACPEAIRLSRGSHCKSWTAAACFGWSIWASEFWPDSCEPTYSEYFSTCFLFLFDLHCLANDHMLRCLRVWWHQPGCRRRPSRRIGFPLCKDRGRWRRTCCSDIAPGKDHRRFGCEDQHVRQDHQEDILDANHALSFSTPFMSSRPALVWGCHHQVFVQGGWSASCSGLVTLFAIMVSPVQHLRITQSVLSLYRGQLLTKRAQGHTVLHEAVAPSAWCLAPSRNRSLQHQTRERALFRWEVDYVDEMEVCYRSNPYHSAKCWSPSRGVANMARRSWTSARCLWCWHHHGRVAAWNGRAHATFWSWWMREAQPSFSAWKIQFGLGGSPREYARCIGWFAPVWQSQGHQVSQAPWPFNAAYLL